MKRCLNNVGGRATGALSMRLHANDPVERIPNAVAATVGERAGKPLVVPA